MDRRRGPSAVQGRQPVDPATYEISGRTAGVSRRVAALTSRLTPAVRLLLRRDMNLPGPLNPSPRLLLGPGPSDAHPRVLRAMATPLVGHLDPQFLEIMNGVQTMLRAAYQTKNQVTFPVSATGMAGMETCFVNLIEPGDAVVVCVAGFFGQRMVEVAERPWGEVFDLNTIREVLQKVRPKVLAIVQAETSTGAWQPLEKLGELCH